MNRDPMLVVFTAIDGALVDRSPHAADWAANALDLLDWEGIPVVLCSQNTRAEIEAVQHTTRIAHPFISENGAALFVPVGYFTESLVDAKEAGTYQIVEFGRPHSYVLLTLQLLASQLGVEIVTFSELAIEDIASVWRVSLDRAKQAKLREYDEPFRIVHRDPSVGRHLVRALHAARLRCIAGDCYQHVNGVLDRSASIKRLRTLYEAAYGCPVLTVGLGNDLCDLALLKEVDLPIIVRDDSPNTAAETLLRKVPTARITSIAGGAGWSQAVIEVVRTIQNMRRTSA